MRVKQDLAVAGYEYGQITEDFIKSKIDGINKAFYICGPPPMMDAIEKQLEKFVWE